MTTLSATTCENSSATSCLHSSAETVYFASLSFLGLVSSFHFSFSFMPALSRQNYLVFWLAIANSHHILPIWIVCWIDQLQLYFATICANKTISPQKAHIDEHSIHRYFNKSNAQSQVFGTFSQGCFAQILYINIQPPQNEGKYPRNNAKIKFPTWLSPWDDV